MEQSMVLMIFTQVVVMFLLAAVGFAMFKSGKLTIEANKGIGNILIFLALPCVIINGFNVEKTPERTIGLLLSAVVALLVLLLSMLLARIFGGKHALDNFAGSFSNPGFFGIPIIVATFGSGAVFYIASFVAFLNMLQWTYGVNLLKNSDENGMLIRKEGKNDFGAAAKKLINSLVKAPFMIAIVIGLFLFFTQIKLPSVVQSCISHIASTNTPLAMFTIGVYLAQTDLKKMFVKLRLYKVSVVKLLIIPIVAMVILKFLPIDNLELKTCILIAAACPVGSNIAVYAQLHNRDYAYAVETVVISTLLSIASLPFVVWLSGFVF